MNREGVLCMEPKGGCIYKNICISYSIDTLQEVNVATDLPEIGNESF